ncbi:hypothetical protein Pelo_17579 [Pelomyxa schiedti]|nr:hypothetical protein Pelo_17579 [Pelomyxa schiedti]
MGVNNHPGHGRFQTPGVTRAPIIVARCRFTGVHRVQPAHSHVRPIIEIQAGPPHAHVHGRQVRANQSEFRVRGVDVGGPRAVEAHIGVQLGHVNGQQRDLDSGLDDDDCDEDDSDDDESECDDDDSDEEDKDDERDDDAEDEAEEDREEDAEDEREDDKEEEREEDSDEEREDDKDDEMEEDRDEEEEEYEDSEPAAATGAGPREMTPERDKEIATRRDTGTQNCDPPRGSCLFDDDQYELLELMSESDLEETEQVRK